MKRALDKSFVSLATAYLSRHPGIRHEWREIKGGFGGDYLDLVCDPDSPHEVWASVREWQITVGVGDGDHHDFENFGRGLSAEAIATEALERFVELLRERGLVAE